MVRHSHTKNIRDVMESNEHIPFFSESDTVHISKSLWNHKDCFLFVAQAGEVFSYRAENMIAIAIRQVFIYVESLSRFKLGAEFWRDIRNKSERVLLTITAFKEFE
jgi:hypothetical protein